MNVGSDLLMFLLPLPMVWQLRLSPREKLGLALVFMGGIVYDNDARMPEEPGWTKNANSMAVIA